MEKQELIELFEDFLNDTGRWFLFVEWLRDRTGKTPKEIGFSEDE